MANNIDINQLIKNNPNLLKGLPQFNLLGTQSGGTAAQPLNQSITNTPTLNNNTSVLQGMVQKANQIPATQSVVNSNNNGLNQSGGGSLGGSAFSQNDINQIMNSTSIKNGQDPFSLDQKSSDELQQILQAIQGSQNQTPNYADIIKQAQNQFNIPGLLQQFSDLQNQANNVNTAYKNTATDLQQQPMLLPQLTGHEAILEQQRQNALGNIVGQQQNVGNLLGQAQGFIGQQLQGAQAQGQLGIQQQGLNLQANLNPSQVALQQAQAQQAQAQAGFYQNLYGGLTNGQVDQNGNPIQGTQGGNQGGQSLPPILQGSTTTDMNGQSYIVESRVPSLGGMGTDLAKSYAGRLGVPILTDAQAQSIAGLDTTQNNLASLQQLINPKSMGGQGLLGSGLGGTLQGVTLNNLEKVLGIANGPLLTQIDSFRESAIKQIQGLASGGTGLRINQSEIDSAIKNLPTTADNLETANAKMQQLGIFFQNQRAAIYALGGLKSSAAQMQATQNSVGWGY